MKLRAFMKAYWWDSILLKITKEPSGFMRALYAMEIVDPMERTILFKGLYRQKEKEITRLLILQGKSSMILCPLFLVV